MHSPPCGQRVILCSCTAEVGYEADILTRCKRHRWPPGCCGGCKTAVNPEGTLPCGTRAHVWSWPPFRSQSCIPDAPGEDAKAGFTSSVCDALVVRMCHCRPWCMAKGRQGCREPVGKREADILGQAWVSLLISGTTGCMSFNHSVSFSFVK